MLRQAIVQVDHVAVKEVVLPFSKFPGADLLLGPEMRSTGRRCTISTPVSLGGPWHALHVFLNLCACSWQTDQYVFNLLKGMASMQEK